MKGELVCEVLDMTEQMVAGAGGIEPPNGGIKIRLIILLFQDVFGKMDEIRSSNFNTLAAVSK